MILDHAGVCLEARVESLLSSLHSPGGMNMAKKADFTSEEWQQILSMPQVAALYLALASPSNPLGLAQEMIASTKGVVETLKSSSGNELIDAVAADIREKAEKRERLEPPLQTSNDLNKMKAQCLQACRDVAALLS